jgi:hypothetical protein
MYSFIESSPQYLWGIETDGAMQGHEMSGPYSDFEGLVASLLHKLKSSSKLEERGDGIFLRAARFGDRL